MHLINALPAPKLNPILNFSNKKETFWLLFYLLFPYCDNPNVLIRLELFDLTIIMKTLGNKGT